MWIVWDTDSGIEMDSFENRGDAREAINLANAASDYDHYEMRWENR